MSFLGAAAIGGLGALGSAFIQSNATDKASDRASDAADRQTDSIMHMFNLTRNDLYPYRQAGLQGLNRLRDQVIGTPESGWQKIEGASPAGDSQSYFDSLKSANPTERSENYLSMITPPGMGGPNPYGLSPEAQARTQGNYTSNMGLDPTGGSKNYIIGGSQGGGGSPRISATGGAERYLGQMEGLDPNKRSQKYQSALDKLTFNLDKNDPIFKWRQEKGEEAINTALAARGIHDSSYAVDRIGDFSMGLQADEVDRQYQQNYLGEKDRLESLYNMSRDMSLQDRQKLFDLYGMASDTGAKQYGQAKDAYGMAADVDAKKYNRNIDLYNMSSQLGAKNYDKYMNLVKLGMGGQTGAANTATGGQLSNVYGNLGRTQSQNELDQGSVWGSFASGLGAMPMNAMAAQNYFQPSAQTPRAPSSYNTTWSPR